MDHPPQPHHAQPIRTVEWCAGYGGLHLGLGRILPALRLLALSEIEAYACANLVAKMEAGLMDPAPLWPNLKTFPVEQFRGVVDLFLAGFPCQPFSCAGVRAADEDPRHLFPYLLAFLIATRPRVVLLENVEGIISAKLGGDGWADPRGTPVLLHVLRELERVGYRPAAGVFSAAEAGYSHGRKRVLILAVDDRLDRRQQVGRPDSSCEVWDRIGEAVRSATAQPSGPVADARRLPESRDRHPLQRGRPEGGPAAQSRGADVADAERGRHRGLSPTITREHGENLHRPAEQGADVADAQHLPGGPEQLPEPRTRGNQGPEHLAMSRGSGEIRLADPGECGCATAGQLREGQPDDGRRRCHLADPARPAGERQSQQLEPVSRPCGCPVADGDGPGCAQHLGPGPALPELGAAECDGGSLPRGPVGPVLPGVRGALVHHSPDARERLPVSGDRRAGGRPLLPPSPPGPGALAEWAAILTHHPELAPAVERPLCGVAHGNPFRVDQLRLCGNGVVPATVERAFLTLWRELFPLNP